eukprot:7347718-Prymnesium_polylepis.1
MPSGAAEQRTPTGNTALHAAVASNHVDTCLALLENTKLQLQGDDMKNEQGLMPIDCCHKRFRLQLDERASEGTYLCFLSHYKKEAGAEASYIKEFVVEKTGRATFLDSDSLRQ